MNTYPHYEVKVKYPTEIDPFNCPWFRGKRKHPDWLQCHECKHKAMTTHGHSFCNHPKFQQRDGYQLSLLEDLLQYPLIPYAKKGVIKGEGNG